MMYFDESKRGDQMLRHLAENGCDRKRLVRLARAAVERGEARLLTMRERGEMIRAQRTTY